MSILSGIRNPSGMFSELPDKTKENIVKIMARIMESAYRRGYHHGADMALHPRDDERWRKLLKKTMIGDLRSSYSFDVSPSLCDLNNCGSVVSGTSSAERLAAEHGLSLIEIGLYEAVRNLEQKENERFSRKLKKRAARRQP